MRTYKIMCFVLVTIILSGCGSDYENEYLASQRQVDDLRQELRETKADLQAAQHDNISRNEDIGRILEDLATVSGSTAMFRIDVENGTAKMTQAEQISTNINAIKQKIAALESAYSSLESKNKEMAKMISGLKKVINEQDNQINYLKNEIATKDIQIKQQCETIIDQKQEISEQLQTIKEQKRKLERTVSEQAKSLYDAGIDFEIIADNPPEVTKNKNKMKVIENQIDTYKIALKYYQKSYDAGYTLANYKIQSVKSKISNLSK